MARPTSLSLSVHTHGETEFKLYALEPITPQKSVRHVLRVGDDVSVFLDEADLLRLREQLGAYLLATAEIAAEATPVEASQGEAA